MTLKPGTIAITLKNRSERNAGRLVRIVNYVGQFACGPDRLEEAYELVPLTSEPFPEVVRELPAGGFMLRPAHRCICDRQYLRPLVHPAGDAAAAGDERESDSDRHAIVCL